MTPVRGCAPHSLGPRRRARDRPTDEQEQANYYQAMFETYWDEPWFMGWCWWDWPARLYDKSEAATDRSFCVYGKKAEDVLREWYAKPRTEAASEIGGAKRTEGPWWRNRHQALRLLFRRVRRTLSYFDCYCTATVVGSIAAIFSRSSTATLLFSSGSPI